VVSRHVLSILGVDSINVVYGMRLSVDSVPCIAPIRSDEDLHQ